MELKMQASIEVKETALPVRYQDRERGVQELVSELIDRLGEDPARDGLFDTPERVERSLPSVREDSLVESQPGREH
jgi:GTP cyclohydrolase I